MTKKQQIEFITDFLKEHKEKEIVVKHHAKLRNGRFGMHPYCICYNSGEVMCRPYTSANVYWSANLQRLTRDELNDIIGRCIISTHP